MGEAIRSIYQKGAVSPTATVASCAAIVSKAAAQGDAVAMRILQNAGRILGEQMRYLIKKHEIPAVVPITISGSVWRGHPIIFEEFYRVLQARDVDRQILVPPFEPIVGAVIRHYAAENGGFDADARTFFEKEYAAFQFSITKRQ